MRSPSFGGQQESPSTTISSQFLASPGSVGPSQWPQSPSTPLSTPAESQTASETQTLPHGPVSFSALSPTVPQHRTPPLVNAQDHAPRTTIQPAATEPCRYCTLTFSSTLTLRQVLFLVAYPPGKNLPDLTCLRRHESSKHQYPCERGCANIALSSGRDRERHYNTGVHLSPSEPRDAKNNYRCRCGKLEHRKDRHSPHVRNCRAPTVTTYSCRLCQQSTDNRRFHQAHLQTCLGAKGRPKKRTEKSLVNF